MTPLVMPKSARDRRSGSPSWLLRSTRRFPGLPSCCTIPVARPHVVNGNDVGMVHRSRDARFLEEARAEYIVAGQVGCQHLDGDNVTESRMLRLKDDAHAAAAENRPQAVTGELVADKRKF